MNPIRMLGTGLLKVENVSKTSKAKTLKENNSRRAKKAASVEVFLREILGTHLIQMQIEKKY